MAEPTHTETGISRLEVLFAVAGIVVLFAAILFVRAASAPANGHGCPVVCKWNLGQIGKACVAYSELYGDFWPAASARDRSTHPDPSRSLILLYPTFIDSLKCFQCPKTQDEPDVYAASRNGHSWLEFGAYESGRGTSYGYDQYAHFRVLAPDSAVAADMDGSSASDPESETANHEGGQNVLYFDTHVSWKATNYASADPLDNIYIAEPNWGPDTDTCIKRTAGD